MSATDTDLPVTGRGLSLGLRMVRRVAGSRLLDDVGVRRRVERALFKATKGGVRSATAAGRQFEAARRLGGVPVRPTPRTPHDLFDVTPDDEQALLRDALREFAAAKVRPAASDADSGAETPAELLLALSELGVSVLGVPEELGGAMQAQAAVTATLAAEALAHGDLGIAYAALAPGAVAAAIGRWGSADQQATYLPDS